MAWEKSACAAQGCPWQEWQKQSLHLHQMDLCWHQSQGLHLSGPERPGLSTEYACASQAAGKATRWEARAFRHG